jgi:hypothetical protein
VTAQSPDGELKDGSSEMVTFGTGKPFIDFAPALNPSIAPFLFPVPVNHKGSPKTQIDTVLMSNSSKATSTTLIRRSSPITVELVKEAETSLSAVITRILDQIRVYHAHVEEQTLCRLRLELDSPLAKGHELIQSRPMFEYDEDLSSIVSVSGSDQNKSVVKLCDPSCNGRNAGETPLDWLPASVHRHFDRQGSDGISITLSDSSTPVFGDEGAIVIDAKSISADFHPPQVEDNENDDD